MAICSTVFSFARIASAVAVSNVSAQSPPMRTNASPREAAASRAVRLSHSPANTSGGSPRRSATAASSAAGSGHTGCCAAGRSGHVITSTMRPA